MKAFIQVGLLAAAVSTLSTNAQFAGGDGAEGSPFLIATADHLNQVRQYLDKYFLQTDDIDLGVAPWNEGEGWIPIGSEESPFVGFYDGGGWAVSGLTINRPEADYQGLFGYAEGAGVANLGCTDFDMVTGHRSGSLVGLIQYGGVISNCYGSGTLVGATRVGGLIGQCWSNNVIRECHVTVHVTGTERVGGIVGNSAYNTILNSQAHGEVSGTFSVGGLVGVQSDGLVAGCHATGTVRGVEGVGGLVGDVWYSGTVDSSHAIGVVGGTDLVGGLVGDSIDGTIYGSFAQGTVTGSVWVGGLVGAQSAGSVRNCHSSSEVRGSAQVGGLVGRIELGAEVKGSHAEGAVQGTWYGGGLVGLHSASVISESHAAGPVQGQNRVGGLVGQMEDGLVERSYAAGPIVGEDGVGGLIGVCIIGTVRHSHAGGAITGVAYVGGLAGAIADGSEVYASYATGTVSGTEMVGGLLGQSWAASVERCHAEGAVVAANLWGGGLVGHQGSGVVSRCHASGSVQGGSDIGGLVGQIEYTSLLQDSYSVGAVSGSHHVGGLVGTLYKGTITVARCRASGSVTGVSHSVGGLVGTFNANGSILDSHAMGPSSGSSPVGGLVGRHESGRIARCYSIGAVQGPSPSGGLIGEQTGGNVEYSYWDIERSGQAQSAAGAGRSTAEMTHPYAANTYEGWDFFDVWAADVDYAVNAGYPYLACTLIYEADAGGILAGPTMQTVPMGGQGQPVTAQPDAGAFFVGWSDGELAAQRTDENIAGGLSVTAFFQSESGVPIDWYAEYEIAPEEGEDWSDVDRRFDPIKRMTLSEQYVADLNPNDPLSVFAVEDVGRVVGLTFHFHSSTSRLYTLQSTFDLKDGSWHNVPDMGPRAGVGGADSMMDAEKAPVGKQYRIRVQAP